MEIVRACETGCRWQLNILLTIKSEVPMGQTTHSFFLEHFYFWEDTNSEFFVSLTVHCFLPHCIKGNIQIQESFWMWSVKSRLLLACSSGVDVFGMFVEEMWLFIDCTCLFSYLDYSPIFSDHLNHHSFFLLSFILLYSHFMIPGHVPL